MSDSLKQALKNATVEEVGAFADYLMHYVEWIVGDSVDGFDANNMRDALEAYPSEFVDGEHVT